MMCRPATKAALALALVALLPLRAAAQPAPPPPPPPPDGTAEPAPPPPPPAPTTPAQEQPAAAPPYQAWKGHGYAPPGSPPPVPPPLPPPTEPEHARRPVELVPGLGLALPQCQSGSQSSDRCEGVKMGFGLGFSAFWRVNPYFAWGGGFDINGFRYDPPARLNLENPGAAGVFLGLLGRAYFLDEGALDPYAELGLGGAVMGTSHQMNGDRFDETGAGPALRIGAGLDFFLSRRIKIGPSIRYTRVFIDKIRRCRSGGSNNDCVDLPKNSDGQLNASTTIYAELTIMLGDEL